MRRVWFPGGCVLLAMVLLVGWQLASWELVKMEFQEYLVDLAAQAGMRIGLPQPSSEEEVRSTIVSDAQKYGIQLDPAQVTYERTGSKLTPPLLRLTAAYQVPVKLPGFTFMLHFNIYSKK